MEFDQKEGTPSNPSGKKETDKKTLVVYIVAGIVSVSSLIYGYASYQATYFKDTEIQKLKSDLEEANIKLQRIDTLENQVKKLEAPLAAKLTVKPEPKKEMKPAVKKEVKKLVPAKKQTNKTKTPASKTKEKKPIKK